MFPKRKCGFAQEDAESGEALFVRFREQGDRAALEELVERWHPIAFGVARCICRHEALAEEAVQDAFAKLLSRQARFEVRGPGSFRAWFLSLVTNSARMARRAERRAEAKKKIDPRTYALCKGRGPDAEPAEGGVEWKTRLERALGGIEERWRVPVVMHFVRGLPQKEMAHTLGISQQMVSRRINRGVALLRLHLAGTSLCLAEEHLAVSTRR